MAKLSHGTIQLFKDPWHHGKALPWYYTTIQRSMASWQSSLLVLQSYLKIHGVMVKLRATLQRATFLNSVCLYVSGIYELDAKLLNLRIMPYISTRIVVVGNWLEIGACRQNQKQNQQIFTNAVTTHFNEVLSNPCQALNCLWNVHNLIIKFSQKFVMNLSPRTG